jgi:outer membrane usher protein
MIRSALVLVALLGVAAIASAQDQRTFADLIINEVAKGDALVVLRGDDALVAVATLREAGVDGFEGAREEIDGLPFVSLKSLDPKVSFVFDERDLKLSLKVDTIYLPAMVHEMRSGRPRELEFRRDSSMFVNYAVNAGDSRDYDIFTESGATLGSALVYSTMTMTKRGPVRGLSNVTIDQRDSVRRWTFGDGFANAGALGGDALVAGVTVSRDFTLDPYFVRYPTLSLTTPVATPSVVELHVNGRMVRQEQVQPGRLDLRNLPLTSGHNDTRIVVRDAFGGTQELSTTYYMTTSVLAPGVQDYQYSFGVARGALGYASWNYEVPVALARHRIGITDSLTAGGHFEMGRGVVNAGPTANLRLPFGEVEASAAFSQMGAIRGHAALASYSYTGHIISAGGSMRMMSPQYSTISMGPAQQRSRVEASVFAAVPVMQRVSLSLQHTQSLADATVPRIRTSVQATTQVFSVADLVFNGSQISDERGPGKELTVGLTFRLGRRTTATTTASVDRDGQRNAVDVQQSLPTATGFGYQLRSETGTSHTSGVLQYQSRFGRYEVRREMIGNTQRSTVSAAGSLVAIGGGVYASRPVRGSYALVRVPGVGDVRGFASNQEVGKTNRGGNLLIPDLLPYYGNQLNISDADVPIDYAISKVSLMLAPPYRGGALVVFPVQQIRNISGKVLVVANGVERPTTYGEMTVQVDGQDVTSPIGSDGRFYFENLATGTYPASVQYADGRCELKLAIPASSETFVQLGTVRCVVQEGR